MATLHPSSPLPTGLPRAVSRHKWRWLVLGVPLTGLAGCGLWWADPTLFWEAIPVAALVWGAALGWPRRAAVLMLLAFLCTLILELIAIFLWQVEVYPPEREFPLVGEFLIVSAGVLFAAVIGGLRLADLLNRSQIPHIEPSQAWPPAGLAAETAQAPVPSAGELKVYGPLAEVLAARRRAASLPPTAADAAGGPSTGEPVHE